MNAEASFSEGFTQCSTMRENELLSTRKHRLLGTKGSLAGAIPCNPRQKGQTQK